MRKSTKKVLMKSSEKRSTKRTLRDIPLGFFGGWSSYGLEVSSGGLGGIRGMKKSKEV